MRFDDERIRFYFRHREQIEQWAALRSEAAAAVDEWMAQLEPDLVELARSLGDDVRVQASTSSDQAYPSFRLTRSSWGDAEDPSACVALEWLRGRTTMRGSFTPYVGLRSTKSHPVGAALRASEDVRRIRLARKDTASAWWVAYTLVAPAGDFPTDTDSYRETLLNALRAVWDAYAPGIDVAIKA